MKTLVSAAIALLVLGSSANAQDTMLNVMREKADIIAHVKVLDIQGGECDEEGVEEWAALCQVVHPIKGPTKRHEKIRFRFNRFHFHKKQEPLLVGKGKEYVIFLEGRSGGVRFPSDTKLEVAHDLLDRWVGALPYHFHLANRLRSREGE